jgi:hypothetical protein
MRLPSAVPIRPCCQSAAGQGKVQLEGGCPNRALKGEAKSGRDDAAGGCWVGSFDARVADADACCHSAEIRGGGRGGRRMTLQRRKGYGEQCDGDLYTAGIAASSICFHTNTLQCDP